MRLFLHFFMGITLLTVGTYQSKHGAFPEHIFIEEVFLRKASVRHFQIAAIAFVATVGGWAVATKVSSLLGFLVGLYGSMATALNAYFSYVFLNGTINMKKSKKDGLTHWVYPSSFINLYSYLMNDNCKPKVPLVSTGKNNFSFEEALVLVCNTFSTIYNNATFEFEIPQTPFDLKPYLSPITFANLLLEEAML